MRDYPKGSGGASKAAQARGKAKVSLVPPARILGEARAFEAGLGKYAREDWRKGGAWSDYFDAAQRHMLAFQSGEDLDPESGLPHLDHAKACLSILETWREEGLGTDDRAGVPRASEDDEEFPSLWGAK
jgi:dATP/dGTP diphosphohydrolase